MRVTAFWESSALVPLCVRQSITPSIASLFRVYEIIVWWATPVEISSVLGRLLRMKQIEANDYARARKLAKNLADLWAVVQPSDSLRNRAMQLVGRYDLRAADALQLSAALAWCEDVPTGRVFLTSDEKLREAALLAGFDAKPI